MRRKVNEGMEGSRGERGKVGEELSYLKAKSIWIDHLVKGKCDTSEKK